MAKSLWKTFKEARRGRRYFAGTIFALIVAAIGGLLFDYFSLSPESGLLVQWKFAPALVAGIVLAAFYYYWLLSYATQLRVRLRSIENLEVVLDELSKRLDEGNSEILNAVVGSEGEFAKWQEKQNRWMTEVEEFLEAHFGLRERNAFKHIVVLEFKLRDGFNDRHIKARNIMAWKLLAIKDIVLRHSDRVSSLREPEDDE